MNQTQGQTRQVAAKKLTALIFPRCKSRGTLVSGAYGGGGRAMEMNSSQKEKKKKRPTPHVCLSGVVMLCYAVPEKNNSTNYSNFRRIIAPKRVRGY